MGMGHTLTVEVARQYLQIRATNWHTVRPGWRSHSACEWTCPDLNIAIAQTLRDKSPGYSDGGKKSAGKKSDDSGDDQCWRALQILPL